MEEDRYTRITLRLPRDLHQKLDEESTRTSKSLNAEIIGRLESSFENDLSALAQVVARLERDLARSEVSHAAGAVVAGVLAEPLLALTSQMPDKAVLPGNPRDMNARQWRDFAKMVLDKGREKKHQIASLFERQRNLDRRWEADVLRAANVDERDEWPDTRPGERSLAGDSGFMEYQIDSRYSGVFDTSPGGLEDPALPRKRREK